VKNVLLSHLLLALLRLAVLEFSSGTSALVHSPMLHFNQPNWEYQKGFKPFGEGVHTNAIRPFRTCPKCPILMIDGWNPPLPL